MTPSAPSKPAPLVSIIVGSTSDAEIVAACRRVLDEVGVPHEARALSAHRTPRELLSYVEQLEARGVRVIIAAAGLAAHLPGFIAAHTQLPVLGVPVSTGPLVGVDALLSIAQMPGGVPVGCLGVGVAGAKNAGYLAARILALGDPNLRRLLDELVERDRQRVLSTELPG
jgi:5-(carboxyamino)imidazole ribonucleotide mutase